MKSREFVAALISSKCRALEIKSKLLVTKAQVFIVKDHDCLYLEWEKMR